jgi:hypothetical protein
MKAFVVAIASLQFSCLTFSVISFFWDNINFAIYFILTSIALALFGFYVIKVVYMEERKEF